MDVAVATAVNAQKGVKMDEFEMMVLLRNCRHHRRRVKNTAKKYPSAMFVLRVEKQAACAASYAEREAASRAFTLLSEGENWEVVREEYEFAISQIRK